MNNPVFGKTMKNVQKYRDIKLVTTEKNIKVFGARHVLERQGMCAVYDQKEHILINLSQFEDATP